MHGENDQISTVLNTEKLFELYGATNKKFITLKGMLHSFLYDLTCEEVVSHVHNWVSYQKRGESMVLYPIAIKSPRVKRSFWYRLTIISIVVSYILVGIMFKTSYAKGSTLSTVLGWPYLLLRHIFFHK
jgi:hypothetical protein